MRLSKLPLVGFILLLIDQWNLWLTESVYSNYQSPRRQWNSDTQRFGSNRVVSRAGSPVSYSLVVEIFFLFLINNARFFEIDSKKNLQDHQVSFRMIPRVETFLKIRTTPIPTSWIQKISLFPLLPFEQITLHSSPFKYPPINLFLTSKYDLFISSLSFPL